MAALDPKRTSRLGQRFISRVPRAMAALFVVALVGIAPQSVLESAPLHPGDVHAEAAVAQGSGTAGCASDGRSGAPAGAVPLYPRLTSAYPYAPTCGFPDRDYGVGATGLGKPMIVKGVSGATITVSGSIPAYLAIGETVYDISSASPATVIPPADTLASINSRSSQFTLTTAPTNPPRVGDSIAAFRPVTCTGVTGTCRAWSPPGNVDVDVRNHLLRVGGAKTLISGVDLSPAGGYVFYGQGCVHPIINNVYLVVGRNGQDLLSSGGRCSGGGTIENSTVDGANTDDGRGANALFGIYYPGAWKVEYVRAINAYSDCFNVAPSAGATIAATIEFTACENNATGARYGAHADWVQQFSDGTGLISNSTTHHNLWLMNASALAGGQGWSCGDGARCSNPDLDDNLIILPLVPGVPPSGVNFICQATEFVGSTIRCINNWVLPTFVFVGFSRITGSSGAYVGVGNVDIRTGATVGP
jgi:hypothetical protein